MAEASKETKSEPTAVEVVSSEYNKALDQGFLGEKVDPAPNEVYTIAGVTAAKKS